MQIPKRCLLTIFWVQSNAVNLWGFHWVLPGYTREDGRPRICHERNLFWGASPSNQGVGGEENSNESIRCRGSVESHGWIQIFRFLLGAGKNEQEVSGLLGDPEATTCQITLQVYYQPSPQLSPLCYYTLSLVSCVALVLSAVFLGFRCLHPKLQDRLTAVMEG